MMKLRHNSPSTIAPGIYPMLYTFFDDQGALRRDPFWVQVDATFDAQAAGVAILGLGTEVSKLTYNERTEVLEVVAKRIDGRKALLVIVYGDTITEQIEFSKRATQSVASALFFNCPRSRWTTQSWQTSSRKLSWRSIALSGFRMHQSTLDPG